MGRPTGRPRPVCRPGQRQRRPASEPAQTGARPGHDPNRPASWSAQGRGEGRACTRAAGQSGDRHERDGDRGGEPRRRYEGDRKGAGEDVQRTSSLPGTHWRGRQGRGWPEMTAWCSTCRGRRRGSTGRPRRVRASRRDSSHEEVEDDAAEAVARSHSNGVVGGVGERDGRVGR